MNSTHRRTKDKTDEKKQYFAAQKLPDTPKSFDSDLVN
jgi:hypothetical protein